MPSLSKLVTLFILIVAPVQRVPAQADSYYLEPEFHCRGGKFLSLGGDTTVLMGVTGHHTPFTSTEVYRYTILHDTLIDGVEKYRYDHLFSSGSSGYEFVQLTDGRVAVLAAVHGCDSYSGIYLGLIDLHTGVQWAVETGLRYDNPYTLSQCGPNLLYVSDGAREEYYNLLGVLSSPVATTMPYQHVVPYGQGYIASVDNVLYRLNGQFQPLSAKSYHKTISHIHRTASETYVLATTDSLYLLDSSLAVLFRRAIAIPRVTAVTSSDSSIWIGKGTELEKLKNTLETIENIPMPPYFEITTLKTSGNKLLLAGVHETPRNTAAFYLTSRLDSIDFSLPYDVQVTTARFEGTPVAFEQHFYPDGYPEANPYYIQYGRISCTVKNTGALPIHSLTLRVNVHVVTALCVEHDKTYMWTQTGLELMPDQETEVLMDSINVCCVSDPSNPVCIWSTAPNGSPDAHPENDEFCLIPDAISSVKEGRNDHLDFHCFPNPTSDYIHLVMDGWDTVRPQEFRLTLYNHLGQSILETAFSSPALLLDVSGLPTGMYFMAINTGISSTAMKRICIQR